MSKHAFRWTTITLISFLALTVAAMVYAESGKVDGWFKAGSDPQGYEIGTVKTERGKAAYIQAIDPDPKKFGTLMQSFNAEDYRGQRIRLTATVRTEDVQNWVGMWMRVDVGEKIGVAFDNMQDRAFKGTRDWQECSIVLDVADDADKIAMGLILAGEGRAEWDDVTFETVSDDVPLTCMRSRNQNKSGPTNLGFEN